MDTANEEFKELLKRSGWNQSEAARNLDLPSGSVSRYVNSIDKPSKQTLRLFKIILAGMDTGPLKLSEPTSEYQLMIREKVKNLLIKTKALDSELCALLEENPPAKKPNSTVADVLALYALKKPKRVSSARPVLKKSEADKHPAPSGHAGS
jgi:transcriptional regulator with XRE-family HTH domain